MKILNITAQKPFSTGSGIFLTELMRAFSSMGHTQALVCGLACDDEICMLDSKHVQNYPVFFNSSEIPFNILGMSDEMPYQSKKYSDLNSDEVEIFKEAYMRKISYAVSEFNPDIIICHHLYLLTSFIAKNFKEKTVVGVCHGTCLRQLKSHYLMNDEIIANLKFLNKIYALHEDQKCDINNILGENIDSKLEIIGAGYNPDIFNINNKIEKYNSNELNLIYAGKISKKKGLLSLIKALNLIKSESIGKKKITLRLAGGNGSLSDFNEIKTEIEKSYHNIYFLGELSQNELSIEFNKSDLFVLPSFYEGLPLVIIEALACGIPVVCTETNGLKNWIESNIKEAPINYVKLPDMVGTDNPVESQLDKFESNLSKAIINAFLYKDSMIKSTLNLDSFTWYNVANKIIKN